MKAKQSIANVADEARMSLDRDIERVMVPDSSPEFVTIAQRTSPRRGSTVPEVECTLLNVHSSLSGISVENARRMTESGVFTWDRILAGHSDGQPFVELLVMSGILLLWSRELLLVKHFLPGKLIGHRLSRCFPTPVSNRSSCE